MKRIKCIVAAIVIFVMNFVFVPNVSAEEEILKSANGLEYELTSYHVEVKVNENNTFDIIELITAYFYVPKHGIYRSIPMRNEVKRQDGTVTRNYARISNINVSDVYSKEFENGNLKLKIGSKDKTHTGEEKYRISYNYNIGKDPLEDKDELYLNLIGTMWDTTISNVTFTIRMPKDFDSEKLGFSAGSYSSTGSDAISYRIEGKDIYGTYDKKLEAYEGINVRLELPEGYFVGAGIEINPMVCIFYVVPVVFFIIIAMFWKKYGKDRQTFVKPEYFPPKGKNSLDVGFLYKGKASSNDVLSLLIYLANKGYLTIEETDEKGFLSKKKGFKLKKVRDYNGEDKNERIFFNGLFKNRDEVTSKDLYDKFYKTTQKIMNNVNEKENREKIFEKRGGIIAASVCMVIISLMAITIPPFMEIGDVEMMIFSIIFPGLGFAAIVAGVSYFIVAKNNAEKSAFVFIMIWGLLFGGIPFISVVLPEITINTVYLVGYIIGLVFIVGQIVFIRILPKRTEYGTQVYAEIKGFKDFLTSVEKDRIEQMVEKYPTYFYAILPYTYVLGISDKWIKKFESLNLQAPKWYSGTDAFDAAMFGSFVNSVMSTASANMGSTASHSSGSGGGGGGFSGGGSGGGGGGSW